MVAYIFLFYLVKHLDRDPINGYFSLDIGFTCYTLFCWGSTISSLGVHLPPDHRGREPSAPKTFGQRGTILLMLVFEAIFLLCFVLGLSLRLSSNFLMKFVETRAEAVPEAAIRGQDLGAAWPARVADQCLAG